MIYGKNDTGLRRRISLHNEPGTIISGHWWDLQDDDLVEWLPGWVFVTEASGRRMGWSAEQVRSYHEDPPTQTGE
jgi:hypothetical protein